MWSTLPLPRPTRCPWSLRGWSLGQGGERGWRVSLTWLVQAFSEEPKFSLGGQESGNWLFLSRGTFLGSSETPTCPCTRDLPPAVPPGGRSSPWRAGAHNPPPAPVSRGAPNTGSSDRVTCTFPDCCPPISLGHDPGSKSPQTTHASKVPAGAWECWEFGLSPELPGPCLVETSNSSQPLTFDPSRFASQFQ